MRLLQRLDPRTSEARSVFGFAQNLYPFAGQNEPYTFTQSGEKVARPNGSLIDYAQQMYKDNGPVFALMMVRQLTFSTVEFKWQNIQDRSLYGNSRLGPLEQPWTGGTTQNLLAKMINDADTAGNSYWLRSQRGLTRLRPDWVDVVIGVDGEGHEETVGYQYRKGGQGDGKFYAASEVCHFMPIQDPVNPWRGMSWLTPVVREVMGDQAATTHKLKFFENAATPNMAVTLPREVTPEQFPEWQRVISAQNEGVNNAYKTMVLGGGADLQVVGANMQQMDFKSTMGASETRLAAAAGVHPVIVGFSEGLSGSSLNAGNYSQARRRYADGTLHPLWQEAAGSLQRIMPKEDGARLWFDTRHVPFLRQDAKDEADIFAVKAAALASLIQGAGYQPDAAVTAVDSLEISALTGNHTGKLSVQLQNMDGTDNE